MLAHVRRAEAVRTPPRARQRQSSVSLDAVDAAAAADKQATEAKAETSEAKVAKGWDVSASRPLSKPIPEPALDVSGQARRDVQPAGLRQQHPGLDLSRLVELNASDNQISKLPAELLLLCRSLRTLNLKRNVLERLPDELVAITALRSLDVSRNQLSSLPSGMGKLGLTALSAADNKIVETPHVHSPDSEHLFDVPFHTQRLHLGGNQIGDAGLTALAKAVESGALASLKYHLLQNNQIGDAGLSALAEAVGKRALASVSFIDLDHNKASEAGKKAMRDVAQTRGFRVDLA